MALLPSNGVCGVGCGQLTMVAGSGGRRQVVRQRQGLSWRMVMVEEEEVEHG